MIESIFTHKMASLVKQISYFEELKLFYFNAIYENMPDTIYENMPDTLTSSNPANTHPHSPRIHILTALKYTSSQP